MPSLNDFGYGVEVRDPVRGVGEDPPGSSPAVTASSVPRGCADDRGQGIDVAGVDGVELFDEAQNGGQFAGKVLNRVGNGQPCEAGCLLDSFSVMLIGGVVSEMMSICLKSWWQRDYERSTTARHKQGPKPEVDLAAMRQTLAQAIG